jgi:hypothetical protein
MRKIVVIARFVTKIKLLFISLMNEKLALVELRRAELEINKQFDISNALYII